MARGFGWNLMMASAVFLPTFLVMSMLELRLRGAPPLEDEFAYHAVGAAVVYLSMLLPVSLGAADTQRRDAPAASLLVRSETKDRSTDPGAVGAFVRGRG